MDFVFILEVRGYLRRSFWGGKGLTFSNFITDLLIAIQCKWA
jgi:hypothetical protein